MMKVKKLLIAAAVLSTVAATSVVSVAEEIVIRLSHVTAAKGHPKGEAAAAFADRVNEQMAGRVKIEVYPNSTLYTDSDVLQAMLLGDVEMAAPSLSKLETYTKKFRLFDLPFLFNDINAVDRFQNSDTGQDMLASLEEFGLLGLGYWHNGMKQFSANKPLMVPADAKGLRFRIQSSDVLKSMIAALGASPQKMAFAEVYGALQTGVVDGQENTFSNIYTKKFFEVQDGVTESNHGVLDYIVVTNADFWNGLPDDVREELTTIFKEVTAEANAGSYGVNMANKDKILAEGGEVRQLTDEQRQQWVEVMKPVWNEFIDDIGQDVLDAAVASNQE